MNASPSFLVGIRKCSQCIRVALLKVSRSITLRECNVANGNGNGLLSSSRPTTVLARNYSNLHHYEERKSSPKKPILDMDPNAFGGWMRKNKIRRCFAVYDRHAGHVKVSHPELEELKRMLEESKHYHNHEAIFMSLGIRTDALMCAFIWNTSRGIAQGGVSILPHTSMKNVLENGLHSSMMTGITAALAGLWVGGGSSIIIEPKVARRHQLSYREKMFFDFGDFLTSLNGCYIASEDIGTTTMDITHARTRSRYVTGLSEDQGGCGNPSHATTKGVICAMEATLDFLKMGTLENKTVAIQGAGNVGQQLVCQLVEKGVSSIHVTDVHENQLDSIRNLHVRESHGSIVLEKVQEYDTGIFAQPCDVFAPCASTGLTRVLTHRTIPLLRARIVCGSAVNQLMDLSDSRLLADMDITHISDVITNRMALVHYASEPFGRQPNDPFMERHFDPTWEYSIYNMTQQILQKSQDDEICPSEAATAIGEQLCKQVDPAWPNRGSQIIYALLRSGWHQQQDYWRRRSNMYWSHSMGV
ncbi:PREDICTED: phenylalanine dehydrogenase-like isoform X2 [Priapulus caudatus]|uniref:Phenylalanine dehydrogenase-like isoform X2 n=1 Tax=Priapulus caudatus TaxID=37621 RepID=A0ABM1DRP0_PRICU|nr:PREDICTED: phenylalanine dehydrogenase-like isoform X2 [Priapulus caudatus]